MIIRRSCTLAIFVLLAGTAVARAESYLFNFDSGLSQITADFSANGSATLSYLPTEGTGGSGAIEYGAGTDLPALVYKLPVENASGTTFTFSIDFRGGNPSVSTRGNVMALGLLSTNTSWIPDSADTYSLRAGIALNNSGGFNLTQFRTLAVSPTVGAGATMKSFSPMLTTDNWYRYVATFTNIGTGFTVEASLYDIGTSGVTPATIIDSASSTLSAPELAADTQIFFGLHGGTDASETTFAKSLDNFSVTVTPVPEPSVIPLLAGCAIVLVIRLLRRRASERGSRIVS